MNFKKIKENKPLTDKRIGILGKGGSGKSTVTVLLAMALRDLGYKVCIVDADSSNVGIHQALGIKKPPVSLIDYLGGATFEGGVVTCPVDDPTPLFKAEIFLDKLPNKYYTHDKKGIFLLTAGKIKDNKPGAGCDGPISKITRDLKVRGVGDNSVTLLDLKAGLEDVSRGVITSLDLVIVVVDPTNASVELSANIKNMVDQIKAGRLPATKHLSDPKLVRMANKIFRESKIKTVAVLLNKIRDDKMERYIKNELKQRGIKPLGLIRDDLAISFSWMKGIPIKRIKNRENVEKFIKQIEKEISQI